MNNDFIWKLHSVTVMFCLIITAVSTTVSMFSLRDLNHKVEVVTNEIRLLKLYIADEYVKNNK